MAIYLPGASEDQERGRKVSVGISVCLNRNLAVEDIKTA